MKLLKRIALSVVVIVAAADIAVAQTYSNTPNDTINLEGFMEDLETLSIQQLNISPDTITLKWKKVSESVPAVWEASACDNQICYTSLVDSGTMNPINPSDYGFLLLHITPHVNYGTAVIRYAVWDENNPALKDTLTYILNVLAPSGISESAGKSFFTIFPNPANEYVNITSNLQKEYEFVITDASGKEIEKGISKTKSISVSTSDFPNGVYSVSVFTAKKLTGTKNFLVQK